MRFNEDGGRAVRLAYVILAHQLPEQLIRLVRRLDGPDTTFLVHVDRRADDAILAAARAELAQPNVTFLPRIRCHWGTWSIVEATLSGIRHAVHADVRFDYLMLMSGQDYPIKPRAEIETTLEQAEGRSFVHHVPLPKPDWPNSLGRVERWHYPPGRRNRLRTRRDGTTRTSRSAGIARMPCPGWQLMSARTRR